MKHLILAAILVFSAKSHATNTKYFCSNVKGTPEWTISVDLEKGLAGFFDNDSLVVVPLTYVRQLESLPPQTIYTFKGEDTGAKPGEIEIQFNETKLKASIRFISKKGTTKFFEAEDGCVVDETIDSE